MFRDLSPEETEHFREPARNSLPGRPDWSLCHPICREICFILACKHDGIDPHSSFIVFSSDNPYFQEAE